MTVPDHEIDARADAEGESAATHAADADADAADAPAAGGGPNAFDTAVYESLRRIAGAYFRGRKEQTLQPTALVHEAWLKMAVGHGAEARDRHHFTAIAATAMRQILVDKARRAATEKHGGGRNRINLSRVGEPAAPEDELDVLALDEALKRLALLDERKARVVELRFFAGATIDDTAEALGVAPSTVSEDWKFARVWLAAELEGDPTPAAKD